MSNREERERLRQQRLASQSGGGSSDRKRLLAGYVVAGILGLAVIGGLVAVLVSGGDGDGSSGDPGCANAHIDPTTGSFDGLDPDCRESTAPPEIQFGDLQASAQQAGCELQLDLPDEGATHVPDTEAVTYKTTPPTSGNHNPQQIADGAYLSELNTDTATSPNVRNFLHAMEHGRVEIHYSPDLPEEDQLALKGVLDEDPGGMLMYPDPTLKGDVALTAWQQLATCDSFDPLVLDVARNFRDTYRGNGPENFGY